MKTEKEIETYIAYYKSAIKQKRKLIQDYQKKLNKLIEKEKFKDLPFYATLISWNTYEMEAQELCLKGLKKIVKKDQIDQLIDDYSKKIDKQKAKIHGVDPDLNESTIEMWYETIANSDLMHHLVKYQGWSMFVEDLKAIQDKTI